MRADDCYRPTTMEERVEDALVKRALGFSYTETRIEDTGKITRTDRYSEPDVRACLTWLYNRAPDRWKYRPEVEQADPLAAIRELVASNKEIAQLMMSEGGGDGESHGREGGPTDCQRAIRQQADRDEPGPSRSASRQQKPKRKTEGLQNGEMLAGGLTLEECQPRSKKSGGARATGQGTKREKTTKEPRGES